MESNEQPTPDNSSTNKSSGSGNSNGSGPCPKAILELVRGLFSAPKASLAKVEVENKSINQIYKQYLLILVALPAIGTFIGTSIVGMSIPFVGTYRVPFFSGLISQIIYYFLMLGMVYVYALVLQKVAASFGGNNSLQKSFQLVAFSMVPVFVGGILNVVPMLGLLGILFAVFTLYLFYLGIPLFTGVEEAKRLLVFIITLVVGLILAVIISMIVSLFTPSTPQPDTSSMFGDTEQGEVMQRMQREFEGLSERMQQDGN